MAKVLGIAPTAAGVLALSCAGQADAVRSIFAAMMKSFSCRPLIFFVCSETVA
jgi:hypothetical protein